MTGEVGDWLQEQGLGAHAQAFADNKIALADLADLTEADLKELGLAAMGERKAFLRAVAAQTTAAIPVTAAAESDTDAPPGRPLEAERRQLTLMFVDLVGSTELSGRLDPEEMRDVLRSYQNAVAGEVTRFDGSVAKYMGDGVLCYFGWPMAHEDDAERAVRAGVSIMQALRRLTLPGQNSDPSTGTGSAVQARAGIATGLVVVGDLLGEGAAREETVVGETPNLAARIQDLARPEQVVVAETTRALLGDIFELRDLGQQDLKGISGPVSAYEIRGERQAESRFEARSSGQISTMVGREQELALMRERWKQARAGEGQLVLLTGEAGIGKSRIARAMIDATAAAEGKEPYTRISYQCSSYHSDSALYPAIQHLTLAAGISVRDSNADKLDKLEVIFDKTDDVALIAALLGLETETRYGPGTLTPQQQRARTLQALVDQFIALSREKPVLFVLEDAHWIDASTLELMDLCLEQIVSAQVLMLITARPTFEYGFGGHPIVSKLALNRLGHEQITAIVATITGGKKLPDELLEEIARKTDGVPLFVEELTKTVLETDALRETTDSYVLNGPLHQLAIPATLHDSLMARLDRLQPIKEVAQIAACIGRQFDYTLIASIAPLAGPELQDALDKLIAAELIFRRGVVPEASFIFKHALVRDAAYESLLKTRRQDIHGQLVGALEAYDNAAPELIAQHASAAGMKEKAITLWRQAGTIAMAQPAYNEAGNHLNAALALIGELADPQAWQETELELLLQLAQVLIAKDGHGSPASSRAFARAAKIIDATDDMELKVATYYGMWIGPYVRADHGICLELATRFVAEVDRQETAVPRLIAHRMRATTLIAMGHSGEALQHLDIAYDLYLQDPNPDFASRFAQEPGAQIQCYQFLAYWMSGQIDRALTIAAAARTAARQTAHTNTICYVSMHHAILALWCREDELVKPVNDEGLTIAKEHEMTLWLQYGLMIDTLHRGRTGDSGATQELANAIGDYIAGGNILFLTLLLAEQARDMLRLGLVEQGMATVHRGLEMVAETSETWAEAELYRLQGDFKFAQNDTHEAEASYRQAIEIARQQGAKTLELRAATSLARSLQQQGKSAEAVDLLQPIYGWFTEGFASRDLIDAKALLAEMDQLAAD